MSPASTCWSTAGWAVSSVKAKNKSPWWVVVGAVAGLLVGNGPLMQFGFTVFVKPLADDFGASRATISTAILVGFVVTGLLTPFAGRLVDRYGVRRVVLPSIVLFALAMAALGFSPASPFAFIVMYGIAGIFAAGQTPLPYAKAVAGAFEQHRGLALGISMAGVGIGAAVVPQIGQALITAYGWRNAYLGLGAFTFLCAFPAVFLWLREPVPMAALGQRASIPGISAKEALRMRELWYLAIIFFAVVIATGGTIAHVVAMLTDRGVAPQMAASAISAAGIALIAGRLLAGYLLDRIFAPYVAIVFILIPLAGLVLLYFPATPAVTLLAIICVGVGLGAEVDLIAFFISRYFGMRAFGEIYGYLFAVFMFGSGLGPFTMGMSFSRTGSYGPALAIFGVGLVVAALLMLRFGPYRFPATGQAPAPHRPGAGESA